MQNVMLRSAYRTIAVLALLTGLALRGITPLGYMPAATGSGLLFELCPDRLPPGFVLPGATASQHQHHHGSDGPQSSAEADQCQVGHLLFSAIAVDQASVDAIAVQQPVDHPLLSEISTSPAVLSAYRSRAPPA